MSAYPESLDVFVNKTGSDYVASSDPNNSFDAVEAVEGLVGALGKPQSWSETLLNLLREYQRGMIVVGTNGVAIVRSGEAMLISSDGNKYVFRRNTADITLAATDIDGGTLVATTYYVYAKADSAATTAPMVFSSNVNVPGGIGTAPFKRIGWFKNEAAGSLSCTHGGSLNAGRVIGMWNLSAIVASSGTTTIPDDDTLPLDNEGDEYMRIKTSPSNVNNYLRIDIIGNFESSAGAQTQFMMALFKNPVGDGSVSAVAAARVNSPSSGSPMMIPLTYYMKAATIAEIIFTVRAGNESGGTTTMNGSTSARKLGGAIISSITITELEG